MKYYHARRRLILSAQEHQPFENSQARLTLPTMTAARPRDPRPALMIDLALSGPESRCNHRCALSYQGLPAG